MLDGFTHAERKMVELAYFSRMTPRAIARELQQAPADVSIGLQAGIAQLYDLFKIQEILSEVEPVMRQPQSARAPH